MNNKEIHNPGYSMALSLVSCIMLLTSCYAYKPYLEKGKTSPEELRANLTQGETYELAMTTGRMYEVKVDSVMSDRLIGAATNENNQKQNDYIILFNQIESVRKKKVSTGLTIIAVAVPIIGMIAVVDTLELNSTGFSK